jgi:hypothetical protein
MNYDYKQTAFSKAILSGLFAGITATLANLVYDFVYRDITQFQPSTIINVPSIILASTLLLTIAGLIFHLFRHYLKRGRAIYKFLLLVLTLLCVYFSIHVQRSADPVITNQFRWLLTGVVIILGSLAVFFIPYLFDHEHIYD